MHRMLRGALLAGAVVPLLVGCAVSSGTAVSGSSEENFDLKRARKAAFDQQSRKTAKVMHHFLVGQLQYSDRDFDAALESYRAATAVVEEPLPIINFRIAEIELKRGNYDLALQNSELAVKAEPTNIDALLMNAGLLEVRGRDEDATRVYQQVLALQPELSEPSVMYAYTLIRLGRYQQALDHLNQALVTQPQGVMLLLAAGRAAEMAGDFDGADRYFKRAQDVDQGKPTYILDRLRISLKRPDKSGAVGLAKELQGALAGDTDEAGEALAMRQLAELILIKEDYSKAAEQLDALGAQENDLVTLRMRFGLAYAQLQRHADAIRQFSLVLLVDPENDSARYLLASAYANSDQGQDAVKQLAKIGKGSALYMQARTLAALIQRQSGDLIGSEKTIREALSVEPENQLLTSYLILVLREQHRYVEAEELLKKTLTDNQSNDRLWFMLGQIQHDQGKEGESLVSMEKVLELDHDNPEALNFVAYGLVTRSDRAPTQAELDRAVELINRAIELRPQEGYFLDTLGWVQYRRGEYQESVYTLERATAMVGADFVVLEHYGDALAKIGNQKRAKEIYQLVLDSMKVEQWRKTETVEARKRDNEAIERRVREKLAAIK